MSGRARLGLIALAVIVAVGAFVVIGTDSEEEKADDPANQAIIATPIRPSRMDASFARLNFSPRNVAASSAVQIGVVNSIEISWASGISVSA